MFFTENTEVILYFFVFYMVEVCRHIGALEMRAKMYAFVLPDGLADSFKEKNIA